MRKATRTAASWLGILAGAAGMEHGYFEILQGNARPENLMIASIGPPCIPGEVWNACEPAMTIVPDFLVTGILAMAIGFFILIWSALFVQRKIGGAILILASIVLLLFGGGFFPPLIGIIGGLAGTRINKPFTGEKQSRLLRFASSLWPWPLVTLVALLVAQFPFGHFFNEFMKSIMGFVLLLILILLPATVYTAYAHDARQERAELRRCDS